MKKCTKNLEMGLKHFYLSVLGEEKINFISSNDEEE